MRALSSGCALLALLALAPVGAQESSELLDERAAVARVLTLSDQRLALMPGVAAFKWQKHSAISDPPREQAVIEHAVALARPLGLSYRGVREFFALQIRLANEVETAAQARWRARGFDFAARIPELATEVRPRLDRLTEELLRALYVAAPLIDREGFASRNGALARETLHAQGWNAVHRAELLAALAAVDSDPAPTLKRIEAAHVLRIGTTADYAPFSLESAGHLEGADIELARALAGELGVEPRFVRTTWSALLADLAAGHFDLAVGGIAETPERAAAAALSPAYLSGGKTIIARCADAARLSSLEALDRPAVQLIVNPGGTNEQFVRSHLTHARIQVHPDNRTIFEALVAGEADAMITDDTEVELQVRRHPQLCRTFAGTLTQAHKVILMAKDAELDAAVDAWLRREIESGQAARWLAGALRQSATPPR